MGRTVYLAGEPAADSLLAESSLALLIGMLLDQQVPMETAFAGPKKIADRFGELSAAAIADADEDEFVALCSEPPAVHRFPGSMARRIQALCRYLVDEYDGAPEALWTRDDPDGATVRKRLTKLPGYGEQKARIFLALLGKQFGVRPTGWRAAAGDYGTANSRRSIADVVDDESLAEVRAFKKQQKRSKR